MIRNALALIIIALAGYSTVAPALAQQEPPLPEGYTAYLIQGEGINAPPIPLKVEGDRVTSPTEGVVTVTESSIEGDRVRLSMDTPVGPARFLGHKHGDALIGFVFFTQDGQRVSTPAGFVPAGQEAEVVPDLADLGRSASISRIEIAPGDVSVKAGESRRFVVRAFDTSGMEVQPQRVEWYSSGGSISEEGEFVGINPAPRRVIALVDGDMVAMTTVTVTKAEIVDLTVFTHVPERLAVGSRLPLDFDALNAVHRWELDPEFQLTSSDPSVLATEGSAIVALKPGRATVTLASGNARKSYEVEVVPGGSGPFQITGAPAGPVRTGDVVHLSTSVPSANPVWSVAGTGAEIFPDGAFVAERPGSHTVVATLGDRTATATLIAEPRAGRGRVHIQGHGSNPGNHSSDLWPQNQFVYVGTHQANQVRTYDVSDPAHPVLSDSQTFDARVVNDVKVSEDGKWLVATREGAANRRNGILIFSLEDPAHPRLVSEYTETLTAGVHNAFWVGTLIYVVNDGTGDMHIIDASDPANPKEVGRWGLPVEGRALHDMWVQEGVAYLSYLRDGLVILDVGGAGKGGTPTEPVQVSRIFYPGGPTHSAFRYGDYVFAGDEDFSLQTTMPSLPGLGPTDPRGPIHVIDVRDLERPKYVGVYEVPEAGAHNFWIQDGVMYVGYYQGGIRVVDVSGELRGNLYRQGREITYFLPQAAPDEAKVPYKPMVWGVFPMFLNGWKPAGDTFFATDYNSGLWSFTVERPEEERPIS